jgi:hypothetical protein
MHESHLQIAALMAVELHRALPSAPALDVLDRAMRRPVPQLIDQSLMHPASPFGQMIAAAFDTAMTPEEWSAWAGEGAEHTIQDALLRVWNDEVLPKFRSRYGFN